MYNLFFTRPKFILQKKEFKTIEVGTCNEMCSPGNSSETGKLSNRLIPSCDMVLTNILGQVHSNPINQHGWGSSTPPGHRHAEGFLKENSWNTYLWQGACELYDSTFTHWPSSFWSLPKLPSLVSSLNSSQGVGSLLLLPLAALQRDATSPSLGLTNDPWGGGMSQCLNKQRT